MTETKQRRRVTAREAAERLGISIRTVQNLTSIPRQEWIDEQAATREAVRAYHDDEGHTWPETAAHFGMSMDAVRKRTYRARKERAAEAKARAFEEAHRFDVPLFD